MKKKINYHYFLLVDFTLNIPIKKIASSTKIKKSLVAKNALQKQLF